jgi:hypothetical protein
MPLPLRTILPPAGHRIERREHHEQVGDAIE